MPSRGAKRKRRKLDEFNVGAPPRGGNGRVVGRTQVPPHGYFLPLSFSLWRTQVPPHGYFLPLSFSSHLQSYCNKRTPCLALPALGGPPQPAPASSPRLQPLCPSSSPARPTMRARSRPPLSSRAWARFFRSSLSSTLLSSTITARRAGARGWAHSRR